MARDKIADINREGLVGSRDHLESPTTPRWRQLEAQLCGVNNSDARVEVHEGFGCLVVIPAAIGGRPQAAQPVFLADEQGCDAFAVMLSRHQDATLALRVAIEETGLAGSARCSAVQPDRRPLQEARALVR
jgi:hypothetical protein